MQASDLVELAGLLAIHGRRFVAGQGRLSRSGIAEYWAASRARFERWSQQLADLQLASPAEPECWPQAAEVVEEILASEILTRVWTAVGSEADRRQGLTFVTPVLRSTLLAHLSARNRALNALAAIDEHQEDAALEINRSRSRSERWTDLLLAHLLPDCEVAEYAFDAIRVQDFADDLPHRPARDELGEPGELLCASLRAAFAGESAEPSRNADLNARIVASIAAGFPAEHLAAKPPFGDVWLQRLAFTSADLEVLVEELLTTDDGELAGMGRAKLRRRAGTAGWV